MYVVSGPSHCPQEKVSMLQWWGAAVKVCFSNTVGSFLQKKTLTWFAAVLHQQPDPSLEELAWERHIAAGLLWLQQKVGEKELRVTGVRTSVNTSDIGTKILSKARMKGLEFLIKMIDGDDQKIGRKSTVRSKRKDMKKNIGKVSKALEEMQEWP